MRGESSHHYYTTIVRLSHVTENKILKKNNHMICSPQKLIIHERYAYQEQHTEVDSNELQDKFLH